MKPHFDRATRSFGSFMCVRNLACLLGHDAAEVIERNGPGPILIGSDPAGKNKSAIGKPANRFGSIPRRIWQRLTGRAAAQ